MEIKTDIEVTDIIARLLADAQREYLENEDKHLYRVLEENVTYWLRMAKDAQTDITFRTQLYIEIDRHIREYVEDGETPTLWDYKDCIQSLPCVEEYGIADGLYKWLVH